LDLAVVLTTLLFIIPAELPDKTFVSCVVLSSRYRPFYVWVGAASGLVVQAGIAVIAGGLLTLLPHRAVQSVVAALFFAGAAYLWFVPEKREQEEGEQLAQREEQLVEGTVHPAADGPAGAGPALAAQTNDATSAGAGAIAQAGAISPPAWRIIASTFGIIVLAEFGDITQILIANLTAHYHDALSVFVGAALGFCIVAVIGVLAGSILTRKVPLALVRKLSAVALAGFGIYTVVTLIRG
jgi:putative Ca2+/H+ antiporter (TMEM165/GDT1 family)